MYLNIVFVYMVSDKEHNKMKVIIEKLYMIDKDLSIHSEDGFAKFFLWDETVDVDNTFESQLNSYASNVYGLEVSVSVQNSGNFEVKIEWDTNNQVSQYKVSP